MLGTRQGVGDREMHQTDKVPALLCFRQVDKEVLSEEVAFELRPK